MNYEAKTSGQQPNKRHRQLEDLDQQIVALEAMRNQILTEEDRTRREAGLQRQGLIYYQMLNQTDGRLRNRQADLLVDLQTDLRAIAYSPVGQEESRLVTLERTLANEQSQRQEEHEPLLTFLEQRLTELGQPKKDGSQRQIERKIIAAAWYRSHAQAQTDRALVHRTRLELGRLRLLTQTDFSDSKATAGLADQLTQIGQDEYRVVVAKKQTEELSAHHSYYEQAASGGDVIPITTRQSRISAEPNIVTPASNYRYVEVEESLLWASQLAQAWDESIEPETFVQDYLEKIGGNLQKDARIAEKESLTNLEQIHQTASSSGMSLARPLGEKLLQLAPNAN